MGVGLGLILDDYKDIGLIGYEIRPQHPRTLEGTPHHWLYGYFIFLAGLAGVGLSALKLMQARNLEANL